MSLKYSQGSYKIIPTELRFSTSNSFGKKI